MASKASPGLLCTLRTAVSSECATEPATCAQGGQPGGARARRTVARGMLFFNLPG